MDKYKSKRKKYFSSNLMAKKRKNLCLQVGFKGFISTTNGNEKQCIRESYNILNEYADKIYGEEAPQKKPTVSDTKEDVMDEFQKEIDELQSKQSGNTERRFQAVDTGILNCIFIKTNLDDPVHLMDTIVRDLFATKMKKTRFLLRMIPVEVTCKSYEDDIKKAAVPLLDKYFKTSEPFSYCIMFNRRHNSNVNRDVLIKELAQLVTDCNSDHKVNLNNPTHVINVEVMRNICCLSVIRDYFQLSKYNLGNICEPPVNKPTKSEIVPESNDAEASESSKLEEESEPPTDTSAIVTDPTEDSNAKGESAPELKSLSITQDSTTSEESTSTPVVN